MSALSNWVTWGIVVQAWLMCSAVLRRTFDIGLRSTSPHRVKSGKGATAGRPAGLEVLALLITWRA